jgi:hypothetical protein
MTDNDRIETTSVSMELPLIRRGKERAKLRRQSFSAYVASLIDADLAKANRTKIPQPKQEVSNAL